MITVRTHSITATDLYRNYKFDKLKYKLPESFKGISKKKLCTSILEDALYEIVLDIVENNTTFAIPTMYGADATLYVKTYDGDRLKYILSKGGFKNVDLMKTGFKAYGLRYRYKTKNNEVNKAVHLGKSLYGKIAEYANNGKIYI